MSHVHINFPGSPRKSYTSFLGFSALLQNDENVHMTILHWPGDMQPLQNMVQKYSPKTAVHFVIYISLVPPIDTTLQNHQPSFRQPYPLQTLWQRWCPVHTAPKASTGLTHPRIFEEWLYDFQSCPCFGACRPLLSTVGPPWYLGEDGASTPETYVEKLSKQVTYWLDGYIWL